MADVLLFVDGFDHYGAGSKMGPSRKWTSSSGFSSLSFATGRFAGQCLTSLGSGITLTKTFPSTHPSLVLGFAFQVSSLASRDIVHFKEGGTSHVKITMESSGQLSAYRDSGSPVLLATSAQVMTASAWHYVEIYIAPADSGGRAKVNVDGATWVDFTGDTRNGATGVLDTITFDNGKIDDLYVLDGVGFLGEVRVSTLYPSADTAQADWAALGGGSHFSQVNETGVDDDTSYVFDSTAGHLDLWAYTDLPGSGLGAIVAVQQSSRVRKDDATARTICNGIKSGSAATLQGATVAMANAYDYIYDLYLTDPNTGIAWTSSGVNAVTAGVKTISP